MATRAATAMVGRARAQPSAITVAALVSAVFLLIGILGFIPGITTDYYDLRFAGHHSDAKLIGVFQVSVVHNIVHLIYGVVGLALARAVAGARVFLIGGGAIYLFLWLYGMIISLNSAVNVIPVNTADNWLHFALGVGMIGLGLLTTRGAPSPGQAGTGRARS